MGFNGLGRTIGAPVSIYGSPNASTLTMGSGAGGNLSCSGAVSGTIYQPDTAKLAGGIIVIYAHSLTVDGTGSVTASANSAASQNDRSVSASGGYILIQGTTLTLGTDQVTAIGGSWAQGATTIHSGDGYIVVKGAVTGTTSPAATQL
jgi:hypothetical protein